MARDLPRHTLARRGLLVLVGLAVVATFISLRSNGTFGEAPHATAVVADAGGALRVGSDVKLNGAIVGRVNEIAPHEDGGVAIDMEMSEQDLAHIPSNVVARILPATVFGTTFVDLVVHGAPAKDKLQAGDTVHADRTQETLELQQALDDIDRLVKALGPKELASAIGSAALALDGRGEQIGRTVEMLNGYLDRLNPRMPQVRADLEALAANVRLVDEIAPELLDATEDSLVFLGSLVEQEASLTAFLTGGTELAAVAEGFLRRNQRDLVTWIVESSALLDAVYDNRQAGISDAIAMNIVLGRALPPTIREGFVEVDGILQTDLPEYYGSDSRPTYGRASMSALMGDAQ